MKNIITKVITLFILCLIGCKNKNESKIFSNYSTIKTIINRSSFIDSLEGDFNFDNKIDILRIEKAYDNKLLFNIYESKSYKPKLSLKNVIYNIGDLKPTQDFTYLSFEKGNIIITQEYGSQSPEGWFIAYIRNKKNLYIVDSISNSYKKKINDNIEIVSKSKTINKNINKVNLISLFNRLSK